MKFKQLLTVCLFGCVALANAEISNVVIELKSGKEIGFLLNDTLEFTHENGNLVVNNNATTSYVIDSVKNFHFTNGENLSVDNQFSTNLSIINLDNATLQVKNALPSEKVMMTSINGMVLFNSKTDTEGSIILTLPEQKGIYVLSIGNRGIKIIRK
ncbi:MAG: hypothetical protein Q4B61_08105 [Bacteroidales bacterium]|nr:hypothetical protein [Paludibacteraceae bacterium]MDO4525281.1 hypothetical protein [Bacteroidales bacterium]